jgi:dUTP diphosphatase
VTLRVRRLRPDAALPDRAYEGDAGYDLRAVEACVLGPGERARVPPGHAGLVLPRSGLAHRHGIALVNAPGLIDEGYRGELQVLLLNTDRADSFSIEPGDRIAQLVLVEVSTPPVEEVDELGASERHAGGFGSSGR